MVRWIDIEVDVTGCHDIPTIQGQCSEAIRNAIAEEADSKPTAVRVRVAGQTLAHSDLMIRIDQLEAELQASMLGLPDCWLESARILTVPPPRRDDAGAEEATDLLSALLAGAENNPELKKDLEDALRPLLEKLPAEIGSDNTAGEAEDAPLLTALRNKDISTLIQEVLPDLRSIHAEA